LRRRIIWVAVMFSAGTHAAESERAWDFNLRQAGTYKVQVTHKLPADTKDFVPGVTKVEYSITIGQETQKREIYLVANQPFVPLITDAPGPQKMRVVITGLSPAVLKSTEVYAYDASTVPPGEYFDPRKTNFPAAVAVAVPDRWGDLARSRTPVSWSSRHAWSERQLPCAEQQSRDSNRAADVARQPSKL